MTREAEGSREGGRQFYAVISVPLISVLLYQYHEEKEFPNASLKDQRRDFTGPGVKAVPWRR